MLGGNLTIPANYVSGIDYIDTYINRSDRTLPVLISISQSRDDLDIKIAKHIPTQLTGSDLTITLPLNKIDFAALVPITETFITRQQAKKSMIGRAAVGGLLFGGAGAIVGAMTAAVPQEATTERCTDYRLFIAYRNDEGGISELEFVIDLMDDLTQQPVELVHQFAYELQKLSPMVSEEEGITSYRFSL